MNKKTLLAALIAAFVLSNTAIAQTRILTRLSPTKTTYESDERTRTTYVAPYDSGALEDAVPLEELQCPIPMECRVRNYTGIQCVFSSTEMIGRWAEEPKLMEPPLTSRPDCKSYSGANDLGNKLTRLGVKFEQTYGNRPQSVALLKKAMAEGRGALIGVPGHAMVCVHYSEEEDRACWVDNSDRSLRVQVASIEAFNRRWSGWVCVVYADNDIIPFKLSPWSKLPVLDEAGNEINMPKDWFPKFVSKPQGLQ